MHRTTLATACLLLLVAWPAWGEGDQLADPIFHDHMVIQRDQPMRLWGIADPGDTVIVSVFETGGIATADANGRWQVEMDLLRAGGPYEARIHTIDRQQEIHDVLIGDVFLCSGQSNMEMPVVRGLNSWSEVNSASNDRIRMAKVGRASSATPREEYPAQLTWEAATPETVGDWSAACYYFARELQRHTDVPIGLIDASWGGSDVRAWMDAQSLAEVGGYDDTLELLRLYGDDTQAAQERFGAQWQAWWAQTSPDGGEPWQPAASARWPQAPAGLGDWKRWGVDELASFDGMVWYRAAFELTAEQAARDAELVLGGVDEVDQTWINGEVVGNTFGWGDVRRYAVPSELLHEGWNVVVSNVFSAWDYGGLVGDTARELRFEDAAGAWSETVPLDDWRYQRVEAPREPPRAPWESIAGRTTIHNAMIAPLAHLPTTAALWYQGESNTTQGLAYAPLLESMIRGWRRQLGKDLPFLVVQLAGFGPRVTAPTESGLANVREAQRLVAASDPRTELVTAVDIGDVYDVHPPNKQEVGRRLARAARHLVYGEEVTPSGPVPARAMRERRAVRVTFDDVDGSLVAFGHDHPIGFELCAEQCRWAEATIDGDATVVLEDGSDAERVRYCWADSPVCTLYDQAGLPAIPFELAIESK